MSEDHTSMAASGFAAEKTGSAKARRFATMSPRIANVTRQLTGDCMR